MTKAIKNHGGSRSGAGRKHKPLKVIKKVLAEQILANVDEQALWTGWLNDPDKGLDALKYLTNRRDGMPPQSVKVGGDGEDGAILVRVIGVGA